jgi:hypothetical protein
MLLRSARKACTCRVERERCRVRQSPTKSTMFGHAAAVSGHCSMVSIRQVMHPCADDTGLCQVADCTRAALGWSCNIQVGWIDLCTLLLATSMWGSMHAYAAGQPQATLFGDYTMTTGQLLLHTTWHSCAPGVQYPASRAAPMACH